MARDTNSTECTKSVVKFQALVRGFLVRKKLSQLKHDYNEIVKCFEGDSAKVRWKTDAKLCLPIVDHGGFDTRERVEVLISDDGREKGLKGSGNLLESSLETELTYSKQFKTTIQSCGNEIKTPENYGKETQNLLVPDADFESTNELINSTSKDNENDNNSPSKDSFNINKGENSGNKGENSGLDISCNSAIKNTSPVSAESSSTNNTVAAKGNVHQTETKEKGQTDIVDKGNSDGPNKDEILYPNDKTSLIKLREDLTMELLWIEQAIESRINYLVMKENMDKQ